MMFSSRLHVSLLYLPTTIHGSWRGNNLWIKKILRRTRKRRREENLERLIWIVLHSGSWIIHFCEWSSKQCVCVQARERYPFRFIFLSFEDSVKIHVSAWLENLIFGVFRFQPPVLSLSNPYILTIRTHFEACEFAIILVLGSSLITHDISY